MPQMLDFARHYGLTITTCVPAHPASKGGSENAVKIAKADLVPCEANLLPEYALRARPGGGQRGCKAY